MVDGAPLSNDDVAVAPDEAGWAVLHLFMRLLPDADPHAIELAIKSCQAASHQVVTVACLGHKADLGVVGLGPSIERLRILQSDLSAAGCVIDSSYVSLTEVSEYAQHVPPAMRRARLRPELPPENMPAFCFYPMSKRRGEKDNWYLLDYDTRLELMRGHGAVGRTFHGRVVQLITASTGLDDYEWGVTLFGRSFDDLKDCVYTMRFDVASARYAQFGTFVTGVVATPHEALRTLGCGRA